ncbi:MAG: DUF2807 domain-containing protein [Bacteroidales bacterium]|nr:DUF2807 domain-containing protein [Bacteroidales bacterium]
MKRVLTYLMIISVMLLTACTQRTGSGNVLTEMRNVDNFVGIIVSGEMSINIIHSDKYEVKITADDNLIKHIKTVVKSGILYVECGHQVEECNITVNLAMPVLNSIETEGRWILMSSLVSQLRTSKSVLLAAATSTSVAFQPLPQSKS